MPASTISRRWQAYSGGSWLYEDRETKEATKRQKEQVCRRKYRYSNKVRVAGIAKRLHHSGQHDDAIDRSTVRSHDGKANEKEARVLVIVE